MSKRGLLGEAVADAGTTNCNAHGYASNASSNNICQNKALLQALMLQNHSSSGVVLEALDAVGVHLIVVGVIIMNDTLIVAALSHLILQLQVK